ncbi:MAG: hypothetical protein V8R51_00005 [Clostridia bacterium]
MQRSGAYTTNRVKLNIKTAKANKELDELELKYKKKKLEIRKYKNESAGLQLELQELELENWKNPGATKNKKNSKRNNEEVF